MMMWRVCWELLVTPSNMQRVMQSLTPRRVSHVIWPSLQNTCLLRSWLRRHSAQLRLGPDDQDSSLRDQCVHWPGCGITCDCAGPQWLVTRPRCRVVTSPLLSWCNTAIPGRGPHQLIRSAPSCRPHSDQLIHVPCCMFRKYIQHPMIILAPVSQIERARGQLSTVQIIWKSSLKYS